MESLIIPVAALLDKRVANYNNNKNYAGEDPQLADEIRYVSDALESVRGEWCALLGETNLPAESNAMMTGILKNILELPESEKSGSSKLKEFGLPKHCRVLPQEDDLRLAETYESCVGWTEKRMSNFKR